MELDTNHFDWAHDAFIALNDHSSPQDKWPAFSNGPTMQPSTFTIPPSLLTHSSVERYGQITPPEQLSPAEPRCDSVREASVPIEQLKNEPLWPEHQMQALQDYQPQQESPEQSQPSATPERSPKRRRTTKQAPASQGQGHSNASQQDTSNNAQPPKRKRGRPKSQPQMVEAYTADGYPFQVSSARQSHLEKNRVAAHKCRQRKKEYITGLEERARVYSSKNKALKENVAMLREEVLELKNEVLRHAGCGFWAVDEYLARCAGDLLGMETPTGTSGPQKPRQTQSPTLSTMQLEKLDRESSAESHPSHGTLHSIDEDDDYGGLELLKDFDDELEE